MARALCWAALGAALLALGCGDHTAAPPDGGRDAHDARDTAADADAAGTSNVDVADGADPDTAADGGDDGDDTSIGLPAPKPPLVDCAPYAGRAGCALHVAPGAAPGGDGLAWATAFADVQDAIDRATCGCAVWIAAGTYLPARGPDDTDPDPRARSFLVWPGVRVFGGFAGDEVSASARPADKTTSLSGDLGDVGTRDDNAYHVVWPGGGAELDGVTVSGGHANGFNVGQGVGAGVFVVGAKVTLRNVSVTDNDAGSGAGIWADAASTLVIDGGTIARNVADVGGGVGTSAATTTIDRTRFFENVGVFIGGAVASQSPMLSVSRATFMRNRGDFGACVALSAGDANVSQSWFEGNVAGLFGGALFLRLGSHARLANSVVVANSSVGHGGGLTIWTASLDVNSCTIVDNSAAFGGGLVVKDGARVSLTDTLLWRNSDDAGKTFFIEGANNRIDVATCDLPPEVPGTASFEKDPLLVNVPLATRFAESKGLRKDQMTLAQADQHFTVGDRIELGDDGLERQVTTVTAGSITFNPAWPVETPRWLRVDRWAAGASSLALDLAPTAASPLVDAASPAAPVLDVGGRARVDEPGAGLSCAAADGPCAAADLGAIEYTPK